MRKSAQALGCVLVLAAGTAAAEVESSVSVGVIHTDNIELSNTDPQPETVLEVIPNVRWHRDSRRLHANLAYQLEGYYYDRLKDSQVFNLFDTTWQVGLIPDRLFLNMGGSRSQAIRDPRQAIAIANVALSPNRVNRDDYYIGPSFDLPTTGYTTVHGDIRRSWVRYDETAVTNGADNYVYDTQSLGVDNYRRREGMTWAWNYSRQFADYGQQFANFEYQRTHVELGFWANASTRLYAQVGVESPWDRPLEPGLSDTFYEIGVVRSVGERLSAEFAAGERSFGTSARMRVDYRFGHTRLNISYADTPSTNAGDRFARGGLLLPNEPNNYLAGSLGIERYISKRGQVGLTFEASRTNISFLVFTDKRVERALPDGTPLGDESQSGANARASWRAGPRTELSVTFAHANRDFELGENIALKSASFAANYRLGERSRLSLRLDDWREQSDVATSGLNYRAKLVSLLFSRDF
jgi:hypothetical protein